MIDSESTACTGAALDTQVAMFVKHCYFHGNSQDINGTGTQPIILINNVFKAASTDSVNIGSIGPSIYAYNNVWYGNAGGTCIKPSGGLPQLELANNVFYGNTDTIKNPFATLTPAVYEQNALGSDTNRGSVTSSRTQITLTADPFTNASSGDFTLNSTAGGGAALKNVAWDLTPPAGNTYEDVGALRHQDPAGGGGTKGF